MHLKLQCEAFELTDTVDWLRVNDGVEGEGSSLGLFTGSELPSVVTSSENFMYIEFSAEANDDALSGFNCKYRAGNTGYNHVRHKCQSLELPRTGL